MNYKKLQEYWERLCSLVDTHGWAVQGVMSDGVRPGFAYTVGLSASGLPEIFAIGLPHSSALSILNTTAQKLLAGEISTTPQTPIPELANLPLAFREDNADRVLSSLSRSALRWSMENGIASCDVIQLVFPDEQGIFPWEPGCQQHIISLQDPTKLLAAEAPADSTSPPRPKPH